MSSPLPQKNRKPEEVYKLSPNFWNLYLAIAPIIFMLLTALSCLAASVCSIISQTMIFVWLTWAFIALAFFFPIFSSISCYFVWRTVQVIQRDADATKQDDS